MATATLPLSTRLSTRLASVAASSTFEPRVRELHRDQRGAIMIMGLCMACFLIGSLWFLIGIGDAIVFRDGMQEVADHAAFTSAVLHAKGMNFISACNLIILAFVFFHILLGLVNDLLWLACLFIPGVDLVACPLFETAHEIYTTYGNDIMKPAVTAIHYGELVAAYGYPWLGSLKGFTLGKDYAGFAPKKRDLNVLVISPSLIPGTGLDAAVNKLFKNNPTLKRTTSAGGRGTGQKLGLPVEAHYNQEVCEKVAHEGIDGLLGFLHIPFLDQAKGIINMAVGAGVKFRYCNSLGFMGTYSDLTRGKPDVTGMLGKVNDKIDKANAKINVSNAKLPAGADPQSEIPGIDIGGALSQLDPGLDQWWGKDGPLYPWSATSNGGPWQEIWSMNLKPEFTDKQEHAVALGGRKLGQTSTVEDAFGYFAEAEFYFDCKKNWDDETCNGDANAAYSVQWRARLRRLEFPEVGTLVGSYIGNFVSHLASVAKMFRELRWAAISLPIGPLTKVVNPVVDYMQKELKKWEQETATKLGSALDPDGINGSFH